MSEIVVASLLGFVVLGSLILLFVQVLHNRTKNRKDELLDILAKRGSFAELWRVCEGIGFVCTVDYEDGTRSQIDLDCFHGRVGQTVSWEKLAITVGSFLVNGKFETENEMTELASRLGEYYQEEWAFLVDDFTRKAGERYKGTLNEDTVVHGLANAFSVARWILFEAREKERMNREEIETRMRIQKILEKNHRIP